MSQPMAEKQIGATPERRQRIGDDRAEKDARDAKGTDKRNGNNDVERRLDKRTRLVAHKQPRSHDMLADRVPRRL